MTDSSTPCSRKLPERRRFLRGATAFIVAGSLAIGAAPSQAAEAEIRAASIDASEELYVLNADIAAELTPLLTDVVSRGVALFFVTEFELSSPRWYWLDEQIVNKTVTYRLSYQSLTASTASPPALCTRTSAPSKRPCAPCCASVTGAVADRSALRVGRSYNAALRFRLDVAELPKPLQVSAFGRKDWNLGTDWYRWTFVAAREAK
jgi:hypothetical protein